LVLREGSKLVAIGFAVGITASASMQKAVAAQAYGVRPLDPLVLLGVMVLLAAIALLACAVPARRAMRVDPMVALRYE
jgi:ABC-type antimicrobial peptide transport system permease subunit